MDAEPSRQFTDSHNRADFCIRIPDFAEKRKKKKNQIQPEFPIDYKPEDQE